MLVLSNFFLNCQVDIRLDFAGLDGEGSLQMARTGVKRVSAGGLPGLLILQLKGRTYGGGRTGT